MKQKAATMQIAEATQQQIKTQGWQSMVMGMESSEYKKNAAAGSYGQQHDGKKEKHTTMQMWKMQQQEVLNSSTCNRNFPYSSKGKCNEFVVHWIEMQYMQQQWV